MSVENFNQLGGALAFLDENTPEQQQRARKSYPRKPLAERFWLKVAKADGCWLWTGARNKFGRGMIGRGGRYGGLVLAPRVSWELHYGPITDSLWVLHKCDNPTCVNPEHLFLGTHQDNINDAKAKGRRCGGHPPGETHPSAKLTTAQVIAIRQDRRSQNKIAADYGVCQSHISAIKRGEYRKAEL